MIHWPDSWALWDNVLALGTSPRSSEHRCPIHNQSLAAALGYFARKSSGARCACHKSEMDRNGTLNASGMGQWKWHLAIGVVRALHQNSQELYERIAWRALHESRFSNRLYDALTSLPGSRLQRYLLSSVDTATTWYINALQLLP